MRRDLICPLQRIQDFKCSFHESERLSSSSLRPILKHTHPRADARWLRIKYMNDWSFNSSMRAIRTPRPNGQE